MIGQNDATTEFGGLPTGAILGEKMGLGRIMICFASVCNSPPV